jgi:hypothetical protein
MRIGKIALVACVTLLLVAALATKVQAAVIITAAQTDSSVVFSTSSGGSLNLTGLSFNRVSSSQAQVCSACGTLGVGGVGSSEAGDTYGVVTVPGSTGTFGTDSTTTFPSSVTGDLLFLNVSGVLYLPSGYTSGDPISANATYAGESLASLGLNPGSYTWSWAGDSVTLNIVPIPPAVWLFGSALGLLGWTRRRAA